eukprot:GILI01007715.1.p1 GENE.GILI01007715.1~~GILI01007715.1.p1  ORF type:complete len:511 (-),score=78.09 GILI01007715.1:63-1595(-)
MPIHPSLDPSRRTQLSFNTELSIHDHTEVFRANKIICTIGPATQSVEMMKRLIKAGMNVARMNFSHGSHEYHATTINNVRTAAKELGVHVGIALDTKGPEIRTGSFDPAEAKIAAGAEVVVTTDIAFKTKGTNEKFYVDYTNITNVVKVGGTIFIDDGNMNLEVVKKLSETELLCKAINSHTLTSNKGCNLPEAGVDLPAVSEQDKRDLLFGAEQQVDFVFASFIRNAEQVRDVRRSLGPKGQHIQIYSKIENWQGVDEIDEIIAESDGIMVARGDLGVEIPAEKVVVAQKIIISKCNIAGKAVICATQMLDSMTSNPRPTRAEVSDVANAVLDGADCVMLSGETAKGKYPIETVEHMSRICTEAQKATWNLSVMENVKDVQPVPMSPEEAICASAVNTISELGAKAVIVLSNTGRSARLISKYRPYVPIMCAAQSEAVCRALTLIRSAVPVYYDTDALGEDLDREKRVALAVERAKEMGICKAGDLVLAVHADHKTKGYANQTRAIYVQ